MVHSGRLFVCWKPAVTAIPSLKYFYLHSHHCTNVNNKCSFKFSNQNFFLWNPLNNLPVVLHRNCLNKDLFLSLNNISKISNLRSLQIANRQSFGHVDGDFNSLKAFSHGHYYEILKSETPAASKLEEDLFFGNCFPASLFDFSFHEKSLNNSSHFTLFSVKNSNYFHNESQPADDPKEKLRILMEKLRIETPMFLTSTNPYHDFTVYSNSIKLLIVRAQKRNLYLNGIKKYKIATSVFRKFLKMLWMKPELDVLGIHLNEEKKIIEVRWRVSGWSRWSVLSTYVFQIPANQSFFDYVSHLHVSDDGIIWLHEVTKMEIETDRVPFREKLRTARQTAVGGLAAMKNYLACGNTAKQESHNFR